MDTYKGFKVESESLSDFSKIMSMGSLTGSPGATKTGRQDTKPGKDKLEIDPENVKNGLGQLVLTLVKLIHELLERQAIRRMDAGSLNDEEIENLGMALMQQAREIDRMRKEFNLDDEDLNIDLGPLGKLL